MSFEALDRQPYLSLRTFRRDGRGVDTPVWFGRDGDALFVFTAPDAGKVKRLRNSARAQVAVCNVSGGVRGPWADASANLVDDAALAAQAHRVLQKKYGWQLRLTDLLSRLAGRIDQRRWIRITAADDR